MKRRRASRRPTFVPRTILNTALVAVVPAIADCAARRREPTVAQMGFVATGGNAEVDAAIADDHAGEPDAVAAVIDAGEAPSARDAGAPPTDASPFSQTEFAPPPPLPVANQGFEIPAPAVAHRAFENPPVRRTPVAADAGTGTRRRR